MPPPRFRKPPAYPSRPASVIDRRRGNGGPRVPAMAKRHTPLLQETPTCYGSRRVAADRGYRARRGSGWPDLAPERGGGAIKKKQKSGLVEQK